METPSRWTESLAVFERPWLIYLHPAKSSDSMSFKVIQPTSKSNRPNCTTYRAMARKELATRREGRTHTAELCTYQIGAKQSLQVTESENKVQFLRWQHLQHIHKYYSKWISIFLDYPVTTMTVLQHF